jgi:hypothetical protein
LNKKRDALRRGIRDLIADTTRELAAFEGRAPEPHLAPEPVPGDESQPGHGHQRSSRGDVPCAAVPHDVPALNGSAVSPDGDRPRPDGNGRPDAAMDAAPGPVAEAAPAQHPAPATAPELATDAVFFQSAAAAEAGRHPTPRTGSRRRKPEVSKSPPGRSARVPAGSARRGESRPARGAGRKPRAPEAPPKQATRGGAVEAFGRQGSRDFVRKGAAAGSRHGADDVGAETAQPAQTESRTGVCRSYFVNRECWRVPAAYCNTALQVCVIRNCPVYHLHKNALERRFAKKFKHFW